MMTSSPPLAGIVIVGAAPERWTCEGQLVLRSQPLVAAAFVRRPRARDWGRVARSRSLPFVGTAVAQTSTVVCCPRQFDSLPPPPPPPLVLRTHQCNGAVRFTHAGGGKPQTVQSLVLPRAEKGAATGDGITKFSPRAPCMQVIFLSASRVLPFRAYRGASTDPMTRAHGLVRSPITSHSPSHVHHRSFAAGNTHAARESQYALPYFIE